MSVRMSIPAFTIEAQRRAADPAASAWVSANAGAGKTKVLTDRVLRLLLSGSPPGRILCLTFTKAAAANMSIRVFERLGRWVTMDEAALRAELLALEGVAPGRDRLRLARRLFARAVETPGGLKIETIHAFCERVLHIAPFEANVPARFAVLDEDQSTELVRATMANVLAEAANGEPVLAEHFRRIAEHASGDTLVKVITAALRNRSMLAGEAAIAAALDRLRAGLDLEPGCTAETIETRILDGGLGHGRWPEIAAALMESGKPTDADRAGALLAAHAIMAPAPRLTAYLAVFHTKAGAPAKKLCTQGVREDVRRMLEDEQARIVALTDVLRAARALSRTEALYRIAGEIRRRVDARKKYLGALDFDDLIARTLDLLRRDDAGWILYKLDRGIDHVLIDEAQDTNPEQWEILRLITADFHAGAGAADGRSRTVFAVGDPKQSIYSFQGADPRKFEDSRRHWERLTRQGGYAFADVPLTVSFRSVKAVLSAVDAVFGVPRHFEGLSFDDRAVGTVHETVRPGVPGVVELWPIERPGEDAEPDAWSQPVDEVETKAPAVLTARRVAQAVRRWTTLGDETGRVWRPGEILILVKKRGPAFLAAIRALKEARVPVAGADRLEIGDHIAVQDLVAAGRAALRPDDDLTLACALKSPLVGLDDEALTRVASRREDGESLAAALARHAESGDAAARRAQGTLTVWRALAREQGPFGFYATLLGPREGRKALVARLGSEAGDAIDAFLCMARQAEQPEAPSLVTFLAGFEGTQRQIKRDLDAGGDEVRVMTVHGAKGLEAGLVVVIDGCQVYGPPPVLLPLAASADGAGAVPVWSPGATYDCQAIASARENRRALEIQEHNRLLYVAMTRAKERLVIAPFMGSGRDTPPEAWCAMVREGLASGPGGLAEVTMPYGPAEIWREGDSEARAAEPADAEHAPAFMAPDWLARPAPAEPEPAPPLRPSGALAAADRPARAGDGPFRAAARQRGVLIHALLERLPGVAPERRRHAALAYVGARAPGLAQDKRERLVDDVLGVVESPDLAPLFGPGSRAEAPVAGLAPLPGRPEGAPVSGQIDRLAVTDEAVLIADFKTSARPPAPDDPTPPAYLAQLALYRVLLAEIYPDKPVRAFLVWTAGPVVRELSAEALDAALGAINAP